MQLYNFFKDRNPNKIYLQTEKAAYTYDDLFEFIDDFEESFLREELSVIALKIEDQALLIFCIWACIYHDQSFILLPSQLNETLEKKLLIEAACFKVITTKEVKKTAPFLIEFITSYQVKEVIPTYGKKALPTIGFISSGTTGTPKLIWNTYEQIQTSLESIHKHNYMPYCAHQHVLISPFLTHSYGFSALLEYSQGNSTIIIPSEASFSGLFRLIAKKEMQSRITAIEAVPYFYKQLLVFKNKIHFSNLIHIGFGGDFVPDTLLKSLREIYLEASFSIRYGISEIPSLIGLNTFTILENNTNSYAILPEYTISIDTANEGEIIVNNTIATGDIGILENNRLKIMDRKSSFIKIKGYKVSPNAIENCILNASSIEDVYVYNKDDKLIANVIPKVSFDKIALTNYLRSKLPLYALPDIIKEVTAIDRTITGKIIRN